MALESLFAYHHNSNVCLLYHMINLALIGLVHQLLNVKRIWVQMEFSSNVDSQRHL
jgi:hypothetical protein